MEPGVLERITSRGVDDLQIVQSVDQRLEAHSEVEDHHCQALRIAPVFFDRLYEMRATPTHAALDSGF